MKMHSTAMVALVAATTLLLALNDGALATNPSFRPRSNESAMPPIRALYLDGYGTQFEAGFSAVVNEWSRGSGLPIIPEYSNVTGVLVVDEYMSMLNVMNAQHKSYWDINVALIWPALYTDLLLPLDSHLSPGFANNFDPGFLPAATVNEQLYVLPYATPKVALFYRADLLDKYNFTPPKTWAQLEHMMETIVPAERAQGRPNFYGYIGQFAAYEGLVCNIMELCGTAGGMIEPDGSLSIVKHPAAQSHILSIMAMLRRWLKAGWLPPSALTAREDQGRRMFQAGQVLFMRNWHIKSWLPVDNGGIGAVAPLPGVTEETSGLATNGATYLGVNRNTRDAKRTMRALEYLLSEEPMWWWARTAGQLPTRSHMLADSSLCQLTETCPLTNLTIVSRPSAATGAKYPQVSALISTHWHSMLSGRTSPEQALDLLKWDLADLLNINLLGAPTAVEWTSASGIVAVVAHIISHLIVAAAAFPLVANRKHLSREQRRASPRLMLMLLGGLALMNAWSLTFVGQPNAVACAMRPVVPGLTWTTILAVMAVQDLQVYLIMTSPLRTVAMNINQRLRLFLGGSLVLQAVMTGAYLFVAIPEPVVVKVGREFQFASCRLSTRQGVPAESAMMTIYVPILLMAVNVWLAARTVLVSNVKTVHRVPVLRVVYLLVVVALISATVILVERLDPITRALILAGVALTQSIGVTRLYVLPRLSPETSMTSLAWMGETQAGSDPSSPFPKRRESSMRGTRGLGSHSVASGGPGSSKDVGLLRQSESFTCRVASSDRLLELQPSLPCIVTLVRESGVLILTEKPSVSGHSPPRFRHVFGLDGQLSAICSSPQRPVKGHLSQALRLNLLSGVLVELCCTSPLPATVSRTVADWQEELSEFAADSSDVGSEQAQPVNAGPVVMSDVGAASAQY